MKFSSLYVINRNPGRFQLRRKVVPVCLPIFRIWLCITAAHLSLACAKATDNAKHTETLQISAPVIRLSESRLVDSARDCDPELFGRLLASASPQTINAQVKGGETALTHAVWFRKSRCVEMLINAGVNLNTRTDGRETALHYALYRGTPEIVWMLLEHGADVQAAEAENGYTVLMIAAGLNRYDALRALLFLGAKPFEQDFKGRTALMHAIRGAHRQSAELLILPSTIDQRDNRGESAIYYSIRARDKYILDRLLEVGANPNARNEYGETPLMLAASRGNEEMVRSLLRHGADPELQDRTGTYDANRIATASGFHSIAELLESPLEIWMIRFSNYF